MKHIGIQKRPLVILLCILASGLSLIGYRWSRGESSPRSQLELARVNEAAISPKSRTTVVSPTTTPVPQIHNLKQVSQVYQTFNNCGPAALSMALSAYGIQASQLELGRELRPYQNPRGDNDDKSVTLDEIEAKVREMGYESYHRPSGSIEMLAKLVSLDMPVVVRTLLEVDEDIGHFRVITGYDLSRRVLVQNDSLHGEQLEFAFEDFEALWAPFNYEFLVFFSAQKDEEVRRVIGELENESVAWRGALGKADKELSTNPNASYGQFNRAIALYHLDRYEEAISAYEASLPNLPSRALWYQIEPVLAYMKLGRYDEVMRITDHLIENENRAYSEVYELRSMIFWVRGDLDKAQEENDKAIKYGAEKGYWRENLKGMDLKLD